MPQVFLNDRAEMFETIPDTWGDLLDQFDARAQRDGVLVTAARLDGVDEPSFRDQNVASRPLAMVARIDVETATPAEFLRASLHDAVSALRRTAANASDTARLFRQADVAPAHQALVDVIGDLRALTGLIGMLGGPLGINLDEITADGVSATAQLATLETVTRMMADAHQGEDWVAVADTLAYDINPACVRFATLLTMVSEVVRSQ